MAGKPIRADVMSYFDKRAGQTVYLKDIAADIKAEPDSVQACIAHLIRLDMMPLDVVIRGQAWAYKPNKVGAKTAEKAGRELMEVIGSTKDGAKVLEDEAGALWKATEL